MDTARHLIAAKIAEGRLPRDVPERTRLGHGDGRLCSACDEAVLASSSAVDVESEREPMLRFHLDCFGMWRVAARHAIGHPAVIDRDRLPSNARVMAPRQRQRS